MAIPYVNAALTAITAVGTSADYDDPGTDGTARWSGTTGIYVAEELVETITPNRIDQVKQTRLEIPYNVGKLIVRGDVLTYTYEDSENKRVAGTITRASLVGRVKVIVEDA